MWKILEFYIRKEVEYCMKSLETSAKESFTQGMEPGNEREKCVMQQIGRAAPYKPFDIRHDATEFGDYLDGIWSGIGPICQCYAPVYPLWDSNIHSVSLYFESIKFAF